MMTVLVTGVSDGAELEALRTCIHTGPHFRIVAHTHDADVALAQARVLLPDIAVVSLHRPDAQGEIERRTLVLALRSFDPPTGIILRRDPHEAAAPIGSGLEPVEGAIHEVRRADLDALHHALLAIGRRRASCNIDPAAH
ncbi:hypothetical protein [Streptomyces sp. NBC_01264]|uniref:hypothetical protein n=1 Tax=Streptomyces sp. NBC_01264 TaxID=2903804 RepID=UPI00224D3890|nr:hypothetical protein [Streptomyces sp. NBC_01264]MCX4775624.1 hypothetical protein [Streptomyces sp. NBC_01264]